MKRLDRWFCRWMSVMAIWAIAWIARADEKVDFDRDVRPLISKYCVECHGPTKQEGGLRLDLRASAFRGGDSYGPAIQPSNASESPLFLFISREDADLKMPPKGARLSSVETDVLRRWIEQGAHWPKDQDAADATSQHWSFQPLTRPTLPAQSPVATSEGNPIDRFVLTKLREHELDSSPQADRATLIRRLYFGLIGLPPTPEDVAAFAANENPLAYEAAVDRLLASPQFGERWARRWLDVVRFAESHGFEMNQSRPNAWHYRDYVIRAFNADKPYDQFIREQLAGDQIGAQEATGFLVGGPWDQVKSPDPVLTAQQRADELHDMINTTGSAFLGLTIGCARCHTHKFDPIPQTDYYALKACLEGVQHGDRAVRDSSLAEAADRKSIEKLRAELADLESQPAVIAVNPRVNVERFAPISVKRVRFTIRATTDAQPCLDELELWTAGPGSRNVALSSAGAIAKASSVFPNSDLHRLEHIHDGRYGNSYSWISNEKGSGWIEIELPQTEMIDRILWGRDREEKFKDRLATDYLIEVSDGGAWKAVASSQDHVDSAARIARRKDLEQKIAVAYEGPRAYAGKFVEPAATMRFHRGDATQPREAIPPGSLTKFGASFQLDPSTPEKERRIALASWISDPRNPLTARVIVNRIWQQYFGEGIVSTPSDFGLNGGRPSHPELLDWLAVELVEHGWNMKHIHRLIVLSATYRQSSTARPEGLAKDSACRLLWRFPTRRLEAEALRDAILSVSGNLDLRAYGPGFDLFEPNSNYVKVYQSRQSFGPAEWRRMVYQSKPRMQLDDTFGAFDCPDSGQIAPKRSRSTTALQALNLLNSPFMSQQTELFAERIRRESGDSSASQVQRAFELVYQRQPTLKESEAAVRLVEMHGLNSLCRALLNSNEFMHVF